MLSQGLAKGVAVGLTQDVYTLAIDILEGVH